MMTAIILAGGENTRIGNNKALLKIGNRTIIEIIIEKLNNEFEESIIVTNSFDEYEYLNTKMVRDVIPGKNSLGGLYSGLVNSKTKHNFVAACDMPFLNTELIKYMKTVCDEDYDVVVPKMSGGYETLHAIYSKNCIGFIKEHLEQNNLKIKDLFKKVRVKEITEDVIKRFDSRLISFMNVNSGDDYRKALNINERIS